MAISFNYMSAECGKRALLLYESRYKMYVVFCFVASYYMMGFFADKSGIAVLALTAIPTAFAYLGVSYIEGSTNTVADKNLTLQPPKIPLFEVNWEATTHYYPSLNVSISPVFSIKAFLNESVLTCLVIFGGWALITLAEFKDVALMAVLAITLTWVKFLLFNLYSAYRIKRGRFTHSKDYVNMEHSGAELSKKCEVALSNFGASKQAKGLFNGLDLLAYQATTLAQVTNELIKEDIVESRTIASEILIIETVINSFIVEVCQTTDDFFKRNNNHKDIAIGVYFKTIFPKLSAEIDRNEDKLIAVLKTIGEIHKTRRASIERTINADAELALLVERAVLPVPAFPEFHELSFPSIEKRVAAQNIVIGSLTELVSAKEKAVSLEVKNKIEGQIEKVKEFVRSLAVGTPESIKRAERLKKSDKEDVLYITSARDDINNIDNHIAITQKYIDSYDKSLSYNEDKYT